MTRTPPSRTLARTLLRLVLVGFVLYAGFVALLYVGQRGLVFPAPQGVASAAEAGLEGFADVVIETEDGERLRAFFRAPEPGRVLTIYFHGNAGSKIQRAPRGRVLAEDGRGVLLLAYRGYSGSTGRPSEAGLLEDGRAAYRFARAHAEPDRIVLYGESLGTGVAVPLAAEVPVAGVILDAPFTAAVDLARRAYPFVPVDLLMRDPFRSIDRIGEIEAPILILHGTADPVTPFAHAERLYAAAPEPKRLVVLEGEGHIRNFENGGLPEIRALLDAIETGASPFGGS